MKTWKEVLVDFCKPNTDLRSVNVFCGNKVEFQVKWYMNETKENRLKYEN